MNVSAFGPALEQLIAWVEGGQTPTAASMNAACGDCLAPAGPGPFGLKVPERRQKGAPVGALVCDGAPGDCPPGATCSTRKHRCE
jgi:hypothetical protein